MKSRRWIAAAALAAAVVFLVMITGERGPAAQNAAPAPVSSSGAVLASDGGPPDENAGGGAEDADREEVVDALQGLLDALGVSADELADCGGQARSDNGDRGDDGGSGNGAGCERSEPTAGERSEAATIRITGFSFGQPLTVAPGARVEVVNTDAAAHNVTAADGSFETPDLNQDEKATFTAPTRPGRYQFTCTIHPEMTGTLVVEGAGGGQGRSGSSESGTGAGRAGGQEGSRQHETTAPGRHDTGGSTDGY